MEYRLIPFLEGFCLQALLIIFLSFQRDFRYFHLYRRLLIINIVLLTIKIAKLPKTCLKGDYFYENGPITLKKIIKPSLNICFIHFLLYKNELIAIVPEAVYQTKHVWRTGESSGLFLWRNESIWWRCWGKRLKTFCPHLTSKFVLFILIFQYSTL